ncbi:MAG: phosphatase PAP2 family protein [candidate division FCPU426 bacterium]
MSALLRTWRVSGLLAAVLLLAAAGPARAESTWWSNSLEIGGQVLSSPVEGSWEGYALAAGCGGLFAAGLLHEREWYRGVQGARDPWQDKIMPPLTLLGDGLVHVGAYAALYQFGDSYDQSVAAMAIEGQINVAVLSTLLKLTFTAERPGAQAEPRDWFTLSLRNLSFPSGHSMTAFCAAAIFGDAYHLEWLTFPLAAAVAYSRVYNEDHWPADVIAGAGLGVLVGYTVRAFHAREGSEPGVRFSVLPGPDGAKVVLTCAF